MQGFLVLLGTAVLCLLVVFVGVPAIVGSVNWWLEFLRTVFKVRRREPKDSIGE